MFTTELIYSYETYLPLNCSWTLLTATCDVVNVKYSMTNITRMITLEGSNESDIRYVITRLNLKPFSDEYK
jgi:hypothetical protein